MSISSVSNNTTPLQTSQMSGAFKQRKQDFAALGSALQAGDLAGAQKAYAALQQDTQGIGQARGGQGDKDDTTQTAQSGTTSTKDMMDQLKQALSTGDMQGAQQAYAAIQQKMQANQSQGHHHHHHGSGSQSGSSSTTSAANTTTSTPSASINVTA